MMGKSPEPDIIWMPLSALQPSQLYINQEKLAVLQAEFDFTDPGVMPPIPVKDLDGLWVMTDGHTRALAAFLAGTSNVPVVIDEDELDWEAYRICVRWCQEAGIETVPHLADRVVSAERYKEVWLDRCLKMQNQLAEKRKL